MAGVAQHVALSPNQDHWLGHLDIPDLPSHTVPTGSKAHRGPSSRCFRRIIHSQRRGFSSPESRQSPGSIVTGLGAVVDQRQHMGVPLVWLSSFRPLLRRSSAKSAGCRRQSPGKSGRVHKRCEPRPGTCAQAPLIRSPSAASPSTTTRPPAGSKPEPPVSLALVPSNVSMMAAATVVLVLAAGWRPRNAKGEDLT